MNTFISQKKILAFFVFISLLLNISSPFYYLNVRAEDNTPVVEETNISEDLPQESYNESSESSENSDSTNTEEPSEVTPTVAVEPTFTPTIMEEPILVPTPSIVELSPTPEDVIVTPTPQEIVESTSNDTEKDCVELENPTLTNNDVWEIESENSSKTKDKVLLNTKYIFPQDDKLSIVFKCLPKNEALRSTLKIERIKVADIKLPTDVKITEEYAYDITTSMKDGTFEYDLTLPKEEGKSATVTYIEKSLEDVKKGVVNTDIKEVSNENIDQKLEDANLIIKDLDHFTIYFIQSFADLTHLTVNDNFLQSEIVFAKATRDTAANIRLRFLNPFGTVTKTCDYEYAKEISCDYTLPSDAPIGQWGIQIGRCDSNCNSISKWNWQGFGEDHFSVIQACGTTTTYEKSNDYTDSIINVDYSSDKKRITVGAFAGYSISNIWLDVEDDSHSGFYLYAQNAINNFNPNPGDQITKAKVEVIKTCTTPDKKVKICHSTSSESNPYNEIEVNINSVSKCLSVNGHGSDSYDIIPSFSYENCNYAGLNWDTKGQEIYNNKCELPVICGNGVIEKDEQCDNDEENGKGYCSNSCKFIPGICLENVNMVNNGDFEKPVVNTNTKWDIFNKNTPFLGWSIFWYQGDNNYANQSRPLDANLELQSLYNGWSAFSGLQYAELDSDWDGPLGTLNNEPSSVKISQTLPTIPDYNYEIKYSYSPRPGTNSSNNKLQSWWDGKALGNHTANGQDNTNWSEFKYNLTATSSNTSLEFADLGAPNSLGTFLDNVSVTCKGPEVKKGTIKICKYNDLDKDGRIDEHEPKIWWPMKVVDTDGADLGETWYTATPKDSCLTLEDMDFGTYDITEDSIPGWVNTYPKDSTTQSITLDSNKKPVTVNFLNYKKPVANIYASKVVCDNESDLPNWATTSNNITATTATDYVNSHPNCHLQQGWNFQWGSIDAANPGDNTSESLNTNWHTFGPTDINGVTKVSLDIQQLLHNDFIWVREVYDNAYLPFSYPNEDYTNRNDVSAEIYCHTDVENYDNLDSVDNIHVGHDYYCVAWNVKLDSIHGVKWEDLNSNGTRDCIEKSENDNTSQVCELEPLLPDWEIFIDKNWNSIWDEDEPKTTTSSDYEHFGWYWFENLTLGSYRICEVQKNGWTQTFPADSNCHEVTLPFNNDEEKLVSVNYVTAPEYNFGNTFETPKLTIEKYNDVNNGVLISKRGGFVKYTIIVKALDNFINNVKVTDLPPFGFNVVNPDNWVVQSNVRGEVSISDPNYASPGEWLIGDMQKDEEVTITYTTKISDDIDPGYYNDLAFATGVSTRNEDVLIATAEPTGYQDTNYVGTSARVELESTSPKAEAEIEEKIETIDEGDVLGASTIILPGTGYDYKLVIALISLLLLSFVMFIVLYKKKYSSTLSLLLILSFLLCNKVSASNLNVRIYEPKTPTNSEFKLSFVTMDVLNRSVIAKCFKKSFADSSFIEFQSLDLINGGTSSKCDVLKSNVLTSDGDYTFKVIVFAGNDSVDSNEVSVIYDGVNPEKPEDFKVDRKDSCNYDLSFKTADDGETSYVEVYRSKDTKYSVDSGSRFKTINVVPNTTYDFTDTLSGSNCGENYYAIRAFDISGNASDVTSQPDITITKVERTTKETTENLLQGDSLLAVSANISEAGNDNNAKVVTNEENKKDTKNTTDNKVNTSEEKTGQVKGASNYNLINILKQNIVLIIGLFVIFIFVIYLLKRSRK